MTTKAIAELAWLVDDLVSRMPDAVVAVLLSADGLPMASSKGHDRDEAEHMSAVAASLFGLARGAGRRFGRGKVRQAVVEMETGFLFVTAAGNGACLAVLTGEHTDAGLMAYEMAMLVARAGQHLGAAARVPATAE